MNDAELLTRALGILHCMAIENTGWRAIFKRWYYADEPLRHAAAIVVRESQFQSMRPSKTRVTGSTERAI